MRQSPSQFGHVFRPSNVGQRKLLAGRAAFLGFFLGSGHQLIAFDLGCLSQFKTFPKRRLALAAEADSTNKSGLPSNRMLASRFFWGMRFFWGELALNNISSIYDKIMILFCRRQATKLAKVSDSRNKHRLEQEKNLLVFSKMNRAQLTWQMRLSNEACATFHRDQCELISARSIIGRRRSGSNVKAASPVA